MNLIKTHNDGQALISSTYWGSPLEAAGKLYCSVNAGDIRILLPRSYDRDLDQVLASCHYAIVSRGPWPKQGLPDAVEILLEDNSDSPYCWHLSHESFDLLPEITDGWTLSIWCLHNDQPQLMVRYAARLRRVASIPDLTPWSDQ